MTNPSQADETEMVFCAMKTDLIIKTTPFMFYRCSLSFIRRCLFLRVLRRFNCRLNLFAIIVVTSVSSYNVFKHLKIDWHQQLNLVIKSI